jgi:peptidoglycan/LPS O-acetylase OafA/YrhL
VRPERVHFPNLNGLRFIAAALVIVHHVEQFRGLFGLPNASGNPAISAMGQLGVLLFFVLSGFLITYLLVREASHTGTVAVRRFYIRRCLRIWPLYYLVVGLSLLVLPHIGAIAVPGWTDALQVHFVRKVLLMAALLPNLVFVLYPPIPYASQAWSVGVEEQFYLIWPWLLKKARSLYVMLGIVVGSHALANLCLAMAQGHVHGAFASRAVAAAGGAWRHFNVDCMAIGGLAAVVYFERRAAILRVLFNRFSQISAYLLIVALATFGFQLPLQLEVPTFGVLFAVVILNLACNPWSIVHLDNGLLDYLGKISYGLYMFHPLVIVTTLLALRGAGRYSGWAHYAATFAGTILLAAASYRFFESPFIRAKVRFSRIVSGDNVRAPVATAAPEEDRKPPWLGSDPGKE